jgi:diadenosine tetraphosphatase ApaH/serine/threonine PP2A family protein phosphatase
MIRSEWNFSSIGCKNIAFRAIPNEPEFITPDDCGHEFPLGREKLMVNVGSVGQPRDEDPRSCYTIIDHSKKMVYFRRVQYDFETTIRKIYAIEELDNMLGDRLRTGR